MREILRHCSQRETPQRNDTGAGVLSMRACAPLRTPSAALHAVQPRCLHGLATRERAFESIPSTSSSAAPRSASCGSRKSCSAVTTSAPSFSITAGSCTALASLVSQERHQLDQHQERAAQAGAIRALKAPPPSFIMRSLPWWCDVSDIVRRLIPTVPKCSDLRAHPRK